MVKTVVNCTYSTVHKVGYTLILYIRFDIQYTYTNIYSLAQLA